MTTGFCNNVGGSSRPCTSNADCPKEMQEYTNHTMTNKHLAFFDGWKWRSLSSAIFDDGQGNGIPGVIGSGDFLLGDKIDHVRLTIKSTTVRIDHWNAQNKGQYVQYAGSICEPDAKRDDTIAGGVAITDPGSGYTSTPTVTVEPPLSGGRQATVTASIEAGAVTALTITDPGMGYTVAPLISIAPPTSGTQATATATLGGSAHYEPGQASWADNIPRKFLGGFNAIRLGNASSCRLCSSDLVDVGGDFANCAAGDWNGTDYRCTDFNQNWNSGATWCKRMSGVSGCYGSNIDDGSNYVTVDTLSVTNGTPDESSGACCHGNGTCTFEEEANCAGTWLGAGTVCSSGSCLGACCQPRGVCSETAINTCSGRFRGEGTDCGSPCCPSPFADCDGDHDTDMDDFAVLQTCLTLGEGVAKTGCDCFDRNTVPGIDSGDVLAFINCATGPSMAQGTIPPECAP